MIEDNALNYTKMKTKRLMLSCAFAWTSLVPTSFATSATWVGFLNCYR